MTRERWRFVAVWMGLLAVCTVFWLVVVLAALAVIQ